MLSKNTPTDCFFGKNIFDRFKLTDVFLKIIIKVYSSIPDDVCPKHFHKNERSREIPANVHIHEHSRRGVVRDEERDPNIN